MLTQSIELRIVEPQAVLVGSEDVYVGVGSPFTITCVITNVSIENLTNREKFTIERRLSEDTETARVRLVERGLEAAQLWQRRATAAIQKFDWRPLGNFRPGTAVREPIVRT